MVGVISTLIWGRYTVTEPLVGIHAFQLDSTTSRPPHMPLVKAMTLMTLINSLYDVLRTSPFHKNHSRLILTVVVEFYQRCSMRFRELILTGEQKPTEADPKVALAADWAPRLDLPPCLFDGFKISKINTPKKDRLYRRETHLESNFVGEDGIVEKNNLIGSIRNLATLWSPYTSLVSGRRTSLYAAVRILSASQRGMFSKPSPRPRCRRPLHSS